MSVSSLQVLADNREALLLAEAVGWLHDYRKCSEEHLRTLAASPQGQGIPRSELANRNPSLNALSISFTQHITGSRSFANLLDNRTWRTDVLGQDVLGQYISRCHNTAHFDKQEPADGKQNYPGTQISSPFGFETAVALNLTNSLWGLPWNDLSSILAQRNVLREKISALLSTTVADSRRPINEVDLWSWGALVGALYKSALAGVLLTGTIPQASNLRWRLLGIRVDGLDYISNVDRISDLLARQALLTDALDKVRGLLEVEYPLGSEIYRDQNGSVYVVPDLSNLLALQDTNGISLETLVHRAFDQGTVKGESQLRLDGEVLPMLILEQRSWWGQDPNWPNSSQDELPGIGQMLAKSIITTASVNAVKGYWQDAQGKPLCPVCRLRPMEEGREACKICLDRRTSRIETWVKKPDQTIWMNEIADHNGRVALLVGRFGLDDWLSGDLVKTMLVKADRDPEKCVPKNPSPARLRRVWETCQRFWQETVEGEILPIHGYGKGTKDIAVRCIRKRLKIVPENKNGWTGKVPYEGVVNGKPIELLWLENEQCFITVINLQLTGELKVGQTITLRDPEDPHKKFRLSIQSVEDPSEKTKRYKPFLPLLSSPDRFLALIPAADALDIADEIREKYTRQFGKVQNRLPLFLGLVFFPRKTPLMAVMDAARRMLETPLSSERWRVECCWTNGEGHNQYVRLSKDGELLTFEVPIKMGDDKTKDVWYPYVFVERFADGTPDNRQYRFQHKNCCRHNNRWLVHVTDLKEDDVVVITPSRFAYLWMDHTARRFAFDPEHDLLLLDELPRLMEMWDALKKSGITDTALHGVQALFERKRTAWGIGDEFKNLVETTLKREGLHNAMWVEDVVSERFARCLELYMHILKRKIKEDQDEV